MLPLTTHYLDDLTPGQYHVFAYDIESDGMLHNGENYPADEDNFNYKQGAELNLIQQPRMCCTCRRSKI